MFFSFEGVFIIKLELSVLQGNLLTTLIFKNFKPFKENSLDMVAYICNSNTGWGGGRWEEGRVRMNQNPKPIRSAYRPCLVVRDWWESYTRQERTKYNLMVIKINKNLKLHFNWINLSDIITGTNYCGQTMK